MSSSHVLPDQEFSNELKEQVKQELGEVYDPCSCMSNHPVSLLDLGLVEDIEIDESAGLVEVTLLLTSQRCTYFIDMSDEVIERVESLPGVEQVEVHQLTSGKIWTPDRMAEEEREARRRRFHERMEQAGITPYAERSG